MTRVAVATRAQIHAWRGHLHEARWKLRHMLARRSSLLLVLIGGAGALGGGYLIGRWCLGLTMIAESVGLIWLGLNQEDGTDLPIRGARTAQQVLDDERLRE
jgi:hypothetical protein